MLPASVALVPALNILNSLSLLHRTHSLPATNIWVHETAAKLSSEQLERNQLIFEYGRGALLFEGDWPDFPSYLDDLTAQSAQRVRERALAWLGVNESSKIAQDQARSWLDSPAILHETIVAHLRELWEGFLEAEWRETSRALAQQVLVLQNDQRSPQWQRDMLAKNKQPPAIPGARPPEVPTVAENLQALVLPDVDEGGPTISAFQRVYVPSAHCGRYAIVLRDGETEYIFFEALRAIPAVMRNSSIGDSELVSRLEALADATRLQIIEMFAEQDLVGAQDIMTRFGLNQSNVSRQIKPLQQYLLESRGKGALKLYKWCPAQLELTLRAVRERVNRREETVRHDDARQSQPEPLRRYMDESGRFTMLPSRHNDRMAALSLISERFESNRTYSEKQVNEIIKGQIAFDDFVTIRRALYDYRFLHRHDDGSKYWIGDRSTNKAPIDL